MKIGILQTGTVPPEMIERHGPYVEMFERMLQRADPDFTASLWDVNESQKSPVRLGMLMVGLSRARRHGVYEDHAWIEPLKAFLRDAHAAQAPIVGVCFGHQILAEALGGKVEKSDRGWGCGIHEYTVLERPEWMEGAKDTIAIQAMHQDQVVELPPGATVLAQSPFCQYAALAYGETAMSIQPHPEFDAAFEREIVTIRRGDVIPEAIADAALEGVDGSNRLRSVRTVDREFFRHASAQRKAA